MKVTVRYFASVREAMGTGAEVLDTQAATLAALRAELVARGGAGAEALAPGRAVRVALDQVMSLESASLTAGCEVAFFPPVTGG
ncbi:molybdopterin converting factor subunit 1 [Rhodoferax saidenbachensis]|uniref:Molybdopterin synthase sulfur carrier subunit n=1 Tax=Rhodoferax saidenbachensis TaxID=1484693 RepID=A0ABU1ZIR2_9BURK|nr:molybdopterin converting factor subunit 1 [Rhodoferax saidenbachensis]MDR7305435.1 molybdopterin synthase sulfur carrier subunit [Rhodoferax saidenbachensis]